MDQGIDNSRKGQLSERLALLRRELEARGLGAFLVPHSDEHQNEFLAPRDERLAWLTGFTGSAGSAIVLPDAAVLFVDGRYTLQARDQVDTELFEVLQTPEAKASGWLKSHLKEGDNVGYDPRLQTMREVERLSEILAKAKITLAAQADNPLDALWHDRPSPSSAPVTLHGLEFAGEPAEAKIETLQETLREQTLDAVLLTQLDSIAWLFNIRGHDTPYIPVVMASALVPAHGRPQLFVDPAKLTPEVQQALNVFAELHAPDALDAALQALGERGACVRLDPDSAPMHFAQILQNAGARVVQGTDPCVPRKAIKNVTEIEGARAAHLRDGAALTRFLAWIAAEDPTSLDELSAAAKLESFRRETNRLKELSFPTISGFGPNGAVVHYRATEATVRKFAPASLYLIDSGGQYLDGTTDVTRTIAIGTPSSGMRRHYTLVLKGHIAIATAQFPKGTRGQDLDPLARRALWQAGLDYDHGTGHGIGSYLAVHEGPQRLSKLGTVALEPGMILSNEPGFYREGHYGVRLENLILVTPPFATEGGEREMLGFETLTLAPFDRALIDHELLTRDETIWLDNYHMEVRRRLGPLIPQDAQAWLAQATKPLA